jgi:beta-N-acetylhexosaminidase
MNRKAIIVGIQKHFLTTHEKSLFKKFQPWGIILFSRNIKNFTQLRNLIVSIRKIFNDKKYPILIDQEGGTVSRLDKIVNFNFFPQNFFGELYKKDKKLFFNYYKTHINNVCYILKKLGINLNNVPMLDLRRKKSHNIIGSRSYSDNEAVVSQLGKILIDQYKKNKIGTVMKHIPGIGLSNCDSHFKTPIIKASKKELIKKDFKPFKNCESTFAMTGHAIYLSYDKNYTATHSKIIINNIIRKKINFKGILISDDISMKALKFKINENALKSLEAGCNLVLHCNGNIQEMSNLLKVIPRIDKFTKQKTSHFYKFLG